MSRTVRWALSLMPSMPWLTVFMTCMSTCVRVTWDFVTPWTPLMAAYCWTFSSGPRLPVCLEKMCGSMKTGTCQAGQSYLLAYINLFYALNNNTKISNGLTLENPHLQEFLDVLFIILSFGSNIQRFALVKCIYSKENSGHNIGRLTC